ncbi:hypothetical protein SISSUDRAFT_1056360 [Sistotremastrum suecicum HHB10207 ss-3]|uniref:Uncharacterized protein n=1 Tax=Sistotremastrum suecicum HHB10207 ss-3 TaxID=1314776 RepID=A0A165WZA7_9AGAM|nr:hypothetical protein SISSUDRAFT_1056360 [Sistotremastrum suecicum HHB10207 ss-3]
MSPTTLTCKRIKLFSRLRKHLRSIILRRRQSKSTPSAVTLYLARRARRLEREDSERERHTPGVSLIALTSHSSHNIDTAPSSNSLTNSFYNSSNSEFSSKSDYGSDGSSDASFAFPAASSSTSSDSNVFPHVAAHSTSSSAHGIHDLRRESIKQRLPPRRELVDRHQKNLPRRRHLLKNFDDPWPALFAENTKSELSKETCWNGVAVSKKWEAWRLDKITNNKNTSNTLVMTADQRQTIRALRDSILYNTRPIGEGPDDVVNHHLAKRRKTFPVPPPIFFE